MQILKWTIGCDLMHGGMKGVFGPTTSWSCEEWHDFTIWFLNIILYF